MPRLTLVVPVVPVVPACPWDCGDWLDSLDTATSLKMVMDDAQHVELPDRMKGDVD